jgi:hypothetical protein
MLGSRSRTCWKALLTSLFFVALPVSAGGIFKCSANGRTVFTDVPCVQASAAQQALRSRHPAAGEAAEAHPQAQLQDEPTAQAAAGARGALRIGMKAEHVTRSWGPPTKVNRIVTAGHVREQWVYSGGQYVYLDDGRVSAVQPSSRP